MRYPLRDKIGSLPTANSTFKDLASCGFDSNRDCQLRYIPNPVLALNVPHPEITT